MLRYETFATVFFHVDLWSSSADATVHYKPVNSPNEWEAVLPDDSGNVIITDLPLDTEFEVSMFNEEGQLTKLSYFTTYEVAEEMDVIALEAHLFNPISKWLSAPNHQNLYDFVTSLEGVHLYEKINVLQQFFYYGKELKDSWAGSLPPDPRNLDPNDPGFPPRPINVEDCLCRPLRLTIGEDLTPVGGDVEIDEKNGNYIGVYGGVNPTGFHDNKGRRWYGYGMKGPAKWQQVWIETSKCVNSTYKEAIGYTNEVLEGEGKESYTYAEPNIAQLKYVFACIGVDDYAPRDCQCERQMQVEVCYEYHAHARAVAEQRGNGCWNGRKAAAVASDYTFVAWKENEYSDDLFIPLEGMELQAAVGCESTPNWTEFLINIGFASLNAYKSLKVDPSNGFLSALFAAYLSDSLKDQIKEVSNTPIIKREGSCGVEQAFNSMDGCTKLDLNINQTMIVALISSSRVHAEGRGRYHANARILSAYGLVGSLQRSDPDQVGEICCRTGHGVYSIATVPTDPEENIATIPPIGELQDFVEFSFLTQGIDLIDDISNINGEFGYRGGGVRKDCLLEIVSGRSNDDSKPQTSESILKSPAELKQNGNTIWLNRDNSDSSPWHFSVYDLSGRLITEKDGNDTEAELIDLENESWPNGIYLGVLRSDKQIIPIKIIHSY